MTPEQKTAFFMQTLRRALLMMARCIESVWGTGEEDRQKQNKRHEARPDQVGAAL